MNSFRVEALWVPFARDPKATHNAVKIALLPPKTPPKSNNYWIKNPRNTTRTEQQQNTHFHSARWWSWHGHQTQSSGCCGTWNSPCGSTKWPRRQSGTPEQPRKVGRATPAPPSPSARGKTFPPSAGRDNQRGEDWEVGERRGGKQWWRRRRTPASRQRVACGREGGIELAGKEGRAARTKSVFSRSPPPRPIFILSMWAHYFMFMMIFFFIIALVLYSNFWI